jgi:regulator of protease activity HflC (stomatin/prohibitin superfamily)
MSESSIFIKWITILILTIVSLIVIAMIFIPKYGVYKQRLEGEALLAHAQSSKEVAVAEAKAKMESASLLADAEVKRAEGVAKANKIIGDSLKDNEAYLRYLWIVDVAGTTNNDKTVVYIPTEGNLPILEAGRFNKANKLPVEK